MYNIAFALLMIAAVGAAQETQNRQVTVVPSIDVKRYMGTWYEIARLPNTFQNKCVSDVTATYSLMEDGDIQVVNRCRKADGSMSEATGRAKKADDDGPNTKLKVRFAPALLSFLPFVWGDYWIIDLASDYSYAVIGDPDRKYLWLLSRTPSMDEVKVQAILDRVKRQGYDLTKLIYTTNTANKGK
ncbi:MAG: lipocalin family protein [Acidobacteriota bacterium]